MKFVKNQKYTIQSILNTDGMMNALSERLIDLGLRANLTIQVIEVLYSGKVVVIQFEKTILALNELEISCLKF